jgi:hypothetical protein
MDAGSTWTVCTDMRVASAHCMLPLRMGDSSRGSMPVRREITTADTICRKKKKLAGVELFRKGLS